MAVDVAFERDHLVGDQIVVGDARQRGTVGGHNDPIVGQISSKHTARFKARGRAVFHQHISGALHKFVERLSLNVGGNPQHLLGGKLFFGQFAFEGLACKAAFCGGGENMYGVGALLIKIGGALSV